MTSENYIEGTRNHKNNAITDKIITKTNIRPTLQSGNDSFRLCKIIFYKLKLHVPT